MSTSALSQYSETESDQDYWNDARAPLASLLFLIPWMAAYEAGVIFLAESQPDVLRNGADFWMRSWLAFAGLSQALLLPVLVLGTLLAWHVVRKYPWQFNLETQIGMLAESILLAVVLVAFGQIHDLLFRLLEPIESEAGLHVMAIPGGLNRAVSFIGAGVYEEVMFRLLLVPAAFLVFRMFEFPSRWAAVMAAVSTSFLFALAHHIGPTADAFNLFTFSFRAAAGMFFATIFLLRGFGITVGCHAAYDLLVGVLLVTPGIE